MKSLGVDELELISKKLTFSPDYTRFRSVCKSWRTAAPKRPQNPWLITVSTDGAGSLVIEFHQFSFATNNFLQISELSFSLISSSCFIGASRGWMVLLNRSTESVSLFNPLTSSSIDLPVLQNRACDDIKWDIYFYLTSDPLSDCFALVYFTYSETLMYCKVGFTDWIEIPHPEFHSEEGIRICCCSGKTFISSLGDLYICDFGLSTGNPSVQKAASFHQDDIQDSYLVESDGDLLFVLKCYFHSIDEDGDERGSYIYFEVFKVEFECEAAKLLALKSLGDRALFLSPWTTFILTASKYPGCKDNCIYFIDDYHYDIFCCVYDLSICDFEKRSSVIINDDDAPCFVDWEHRNWFTPSILE